MSPPGYCLPLWYLRPWLPKNRQVRTRNLIVGFTYAYDNEGNKFYEQETHETGRSEAYTYDSVYRLVDYQVGTL